MRSVVWPAACSFGLVIDEWFTAVLGKWVAKYPRLPRTGLVLWIGVALAVFVFGALHPNRVAQSSQVQMPVLLPISAAAPVCLPTGQIVSGRVIVHQIPARSFLVNFTSSKQ